jgi:hypothetical protein
MFTAVAIPTILIVGLGTEAGSWYLIQRRAQNAADAAAYAGALALTVSQSANTEGLAYAAQNGFCNTGATGCTAPPAGATQSVNIAVGIVNGNTRVTSVVAQYQPPLLTSLVFNRPVTISAQAAAEIKHPQQPCALSLTGTLTIGGSQTFTGGNCTVMSDGNVKFNSGATFSGSGWYVGGTSGCSPLQWCNLAGSASDYFLPPTTQPTALTQLEADTANGTIPAEPNKPTNIPPCANNTTCTYSSSTAWQGNLTVNSGAVANLQNGIYLFDSLTIGGTLQLAPGATGVNIIVGSGGITFTGSGTVNLQAATNNTGSNLARDLNGVLIYDTETTSAKINGGSNSIYTGALFFPNSDVTWSGNAAGNSNCTEIVAKSLTFTGNTYLNVSGCAPSLVPVSQLVLLVQ